MVHDKNTNTNSNFIKEIITKDLVDDSKNDAVITRFPPEPNGYLHIGHAKSITLNFGLADEFNGVCNLRFDDTNPTKENTTFVDSIKNDIEWLGWNSDNHLYFASDYFPKLYEFAVTLIKSGKAYVDDLTQEQIREFRGTLIKPGKESPYRERSVEENLNFSGVLCAKCEIAAVAMSPPHESSIVIGIFNSTHKSLICLLLYIPPNLLILRFIISIAPS